MKKIVITLSALLFIITSINSQNIPITTKSKEALDFYKKGWQLEDKLELDEAEKMYQEAVNIDNTFALAYLRLAMVKDNYDVRKQQLIEAEKHLEHVSEAEKLWIKGRRDFYATGYDGSKEYGYFKQLVELYPNDEMANYLFAYVNLNHGVLKPDLAIHHFERAIKINSNFIRPYNELIYTYLEKKDFKNAKKITEKYIKLLPSSVNPLDTYAEIFMRSGEYKKSINIYNKVLKIDPQFPWALMGITANMNFLGKHKEGRNYTIKLEENHLTHYEYRHKWKALVTSYLDEGDFDQAITTLEKQKQESVTGRNKREPSFHMYFSFLRKTRFYFENNQSKQGLLEYKEWYKYINESDRSEKAKTSIRNLENYYLAYAAFLDNKLEDTSMYLNNYTSSNEGETDASKILLSRVLLANEQIEKAINKILETDLNSPYNQYWLMIAYKKAGDTKNVKKYRDKILSLNDRNNIDLSLVRRKTLDFEI
jgi:tetratricopeptide (TPR) repeat protein